MSHILHPTTPVTPLIQAYFGGFFYAYITLLFTKPTIDIDAQNALLRSRGLAIASL